MSTKRKLTRVDTPQMQPGFLGAGHTARPVISGGFANSDPFIIMMDDILDKKDTIPVGGPHPHAGFETVSFLLEGEMGDDAHKMKSGDFQMMTAGSGVIHTETIDTVSKMRLLQLWLNLPSTNRWAPPRLQDLSANHAPSFNRDGVHIKLYSGELAGLKSPVQNYVPLIVADIILEAGVSTSLQLPANYNSFLYVIKGTVKVGEEEKPLNESQVGWLNLLTEDVESDLYLSADEEAMRVVLYAGKPTGDTIVSHGPFIGDSTEDIQRLYQDYRRGKIKHISTVPDSQKIVL